MRMKTIYASETGAKLDSDVYTGGGTDDTAALQKALDTAKDEGAVRLVMDGSALITGLTVYSDTTIECLSDACGFYQADNSNRAMIVNAHPSRGERIDRNIKLIGGTYNQNCLHQAHHVPPEKPYPEGDSLVVCISFFGIENLMIRDVVIRNHRTFAFLITNWEKVTMENIRFELPDYMHGNQDGIHMQGPGRFLVIRNVQGKTSDDMIALNGDEEINGNDRNWMHPHATVGPMSDILVDTVVCDDASQVIRILSRENLIDRVTIRNVSGTYRSFGFYLHAWDLRKKGFQGDYGSVFIENVDLRQTEADYNYTKRFLFRISGKHKCMTLKNIYYRDPTDDRYVIWLEGISDMKGMGFAPAQVESLVIDGLHIQDEGDTPQTFPYIAAEGKIKRMVIRNSELYCKAGKEPVFLSAAGEVADIGRLAMYNVVSENVGTLIDDPEGNIKALEVDSEEWE